MQTNTNYNAMQKKMETAFSLVDPSKVRGAHWKDAIAAYLTPHQLTTAGLTLGDVLEAIAYFTGTEGKVHEVGGFLYVTAPGYWAGPCN